ncbi:hypothetical protein GA0115242_103421 [Streptomyces sp. SolWspMP-5a-2]|nr:hypothetical protein GA0115242_103421 [Streptomyces sp. SolWspMP-5a-2]
MNHRPPTAPVPTAPVPTGPILPPVPVPVPVPAPAHHIPRAIRVRRSPR